MITTKLENGEIGNLDFSIHFANSFYYVKSILIQKKYKQEEEVGPFMTLKDAEDFMGLCSRSEVLPANICGVYEDQRFIDIMRI